MSRVSLSGNALGTGTFTIASPNSNTDRTLTLPDATGTVLTTATPGVPVNGPAFSAYMSASQSLGNATFTKLQMNTEVFDTNSNYDTSTYRFTPTVAGYYQCSGGYSLSASSVTCLVDIYKNGARTLEAAIPNNAGGITVAVSGLIYLNGSTDYIEAYAYQASGGSVNTGNTGSIYGNYFQAFLARSAA
jgi:hypothetical protein